MTKAILMKINNKRLKVYLRKCRKDYEGYMRGNYYCDICQEYHLPEEKDIRQQELKNILVEAITEYNTRKFLNLL